MNDPAAYVTPAGAEWLASSSAFPRSVHALWAVRPGAPSTLPCGTAFDVVSTGALFGRRVLDRLWISGPGTGPVALHAGRMLLFAEPGTAQRLPALLRWREWRGSSVPAPAGRDGTNGADGTAETIPPLLCYGLGDTVTIPPPVPGGGCPPTTRWLVAPDVRKPWLPGAEALLWACVRAVREGGRALAGSRDQPISAPSDQGAKVYHVNRRR
ncbi:bifunctional DNA primase/polymerase [Streptomyces sp. CNQ085]|uniref:bifunctional DNA primase/polymerase n=1 Tax=Streptomyces sp. CNQ085 TaxID=2886944 RepID=UPI001F513238|nr:bifunctional DNA primase/polymerase [Streptomyces sp. CNQ085]MCI0385700.1 bifunctional DNA primase/polymerase [Streptomyces sp. CNQ085]